MRRSIVHLAPLALAISGCASQDLWTEEDSTYFRVYAATSIVDTYTTIQSLKRPDLIEKNPIVYNVVGERPDNGTLVVGTAIIIGTNYLIARALPDKYRRKYLAVWASSHTYLAISNIKLNRSKENFVNDDIELVYDYPQ